MKTKPGFSSSPFIIVFLAICLFPWTDSIFKFDANSAPDENGQSAAPPKLPSVLTAFTGFPGELNSYFNNRFGFRRFLIQAHGELMTRVLHTSPNRHVVMGRDDWLFFEPDIRYLTTFEDGGFIAGKASPLQAITDFNRQLGARNIKLVLLPVPVKPMFYPDKLSPAFNNADGYLQNPAYERFKSGLEKENIPVLDAAAVMRELKSTPYNPVFLKTDTHWSPEAVAATAKSVTASVEAYVPLSKYNKVKLEMKATDVENAGDLAGLLFSGARSDPRYAERVTVEKIVSGGGAPWASDPDAEILFLGDSFANIYSQGLLGWGESAGIVERLSYFLNRPVDRICQNDNGAYATRQALQSELSRGRDRLANKKVVIWEFAVRELTAGDWKTLDMKLGAKKTGAFFTPAPGSGAVISGVVAAVSEKPVPGKSPYKEHVMSFHLTDVTVDGSAGENRDALVYALSMKDDRLTAAADWRVGQMVALRVKNWNDVAATYDSINRSELDDEDLLSVDPCWCEEILK